MEIGNRINPHGMFNGIWIPEAMVKYKKISPGAKLCYGRLTRYSGKDGKAYPSYKTLAAELGIKERQAKNYIKELKDDGLIEIKHSQTTNHYYFLWHEVLDDSLKVANEDINPRVQDNALPGGNILHSGDAIKCTPDDTPETPPGKAIDGDSGQLRESVNENKNKERGAALSKSSSNETRKAIASWKDIFSKKQGFKPTLTAKDTKTLERLLSEHGYKQTVLLMQEYINNANDREIEAGYALSWLPGAANRLLGDRAKRADAEKDTKRRKIDMLINKILYNGYKENQEQIDQYSEDEQNEIIKKVEHHATLPQFQDVVKNWREYEENECLTA